MQESKVSTKAKFEDAISQTGYGKFNINVLGASGGSLMVVIIETMSMMMIVPAAQCDLELNLTTKGILNAISFLGVVASSHFWGFIADTRGRRNVLIISMLFSFITSIIASFAPWAWLFILIRFINGLFVGGASAVVYAYVGEFHDQAHRPRVVSIIATFVALGNMIIPGFAWAILPMDFSYFVPGLNLEFKAWRLLLVCYGAPSLVFGLWLLCLPESPKYLMSQGQTAEVLEILQEMYAQNTGNKKEDYPITEIIWDETAEMDEDKNANILKKMWMQTVPLFKKAYVMKTFMVCLLQFGAFASSSGLIMWYPEILNRMALFTREVPNEPLTLCNAIEYYNNKTDKTIEEDNSGICFDHVEEDVFLTSLMIEAAFAIVYIFIGIVINVVGPKNLLIIFLLVTTSCGIAAQNITGAIAVESLIGLFLVVATCVGVINAIVVDLFPTQLRAMALALSLMMGRFGAVAGSNLTGPLIYNLCDYAFYIYAIDHLILIITVFCLPSSPNAKKMIDVNV